VRLHFCETFFTTAGSQVFNVTINGTQGLNIANIKQFTVPANAT
jgi:hypothetical protein